MPKMSVHSTLLVCAVLLVHSARAQRTQLPDTIHKNEVFINVAPAIIPLIGGTPGTTSNFSAGYRRYITPHFILRTGFVIFPSWSSDYYMNGVPVYDRTVDEKYVFKTYSFWHGVKVQVNIGGEKVFHKRRWTHGFGVDLFTNYRSQNESESYFYGLDSTASQFTFGNAQPNGIDSLGFLHYGHEIGIGFQAFYSVRYDLGKRWRISATVGPSMNFTWGLVNYQDYAKDTEGTYKTWGFYLPNVPFVSDVSVGYRF